jgi:hypothetical protein
MSNKLLASAGLAVLLSTGFVASAFAADASPDVVTRAGTSVKTGAENYGHHHRIKSPGAGGPVEQVIHKSSQSSND